MKKLFALMFVSLLAVGCKTTNEYPVLQEDQRRINRGRMLDNATVDLKGLAQGVGSKVTDTAVSETKDALWKAALGQLSDKPLSVVDKAAGIITTDWFNPDNNASERVKLNTTIGDSLSAESIGINMFRQILGSNGQWTSAPADQGYVNNLQSQILSEAIKFVAN